MQPTSIRLPADIQALIRSLAGPGESTSSVICRAVRALAGVPVLPDPTAWVSRMEALERRMEALEAARSVVQSVVEPVANSVVESVVEHVVAPVAQAVVKPVAPGSGTRYPPEVRDMALSMKAQGARNTEIMQAIKARLGYSPDSAGIGRCLARWAGGNAPT